MICIHATKIQMEAEIQNIVFQKYSAIRKNAKTKIRKNAKNGTDVQTDTKSSNGQCRTVPEKVNCVRERMRQLSENKIKSR